MNNVALLELATECQGVFATFQCDGTTLHEPGKSLAAPHPRPLQQTRRVSHHNHHYHRHHGHRQSIGDKFKHNKAFVMDMPLNVETPLQSHTNSGSSQKVSDLESLNLKVNAKVSSWHSGASKARQGNGAQGKERHCPAVHCLAVALPMSSSTLPFVLLCLALLSLALPCTAKRGDHWLMKKI